MAPQLLRSERLGSKRVLDELAQSDGFVLEHVAVDQRLDVQAGENLGDVGLEVGGRDLWRIKRGSAVG